jgi:hypothetical protein
MMQGTPLRGKCPDIVARAFELARAVDIFVEHARRFYYEVMLSGHACPACTGPLVMLKDSHCQCSSCQRTLDPTVAFQRCTACSGVPRLRIRRYRCSGCGADLPSLFAFDGLVFDREYFRARMAESRQRRKEEKKSFVARLPELRSPAAEPAVADIASIPGLAEALNSLTLPPAVAALLPLCRGFDLALYERHIQAHIGDTAICFDEIPPLEADLRRDRIWRFVAIIFMAHHGVLEVWQEQEAILVMKRETYREGQAIPGASEAADGV